jgi:DNA-directed RNA polymerase subunit RPC12/RpoP
MEEFPLQKHEYLQCPCGKKQWGYTGDIGDIYICYNCGRYKGKGVHPVMTDMAHADPALLLEMIEIGALKKIELGK